MRSLAKLLLELLSMWEQYKADQKRMRRDAAIEKARNDPVGAFNDHFGGVPDDSAKASETGKAEH